ncbi:hypothetical protein OESDEN_02351 [Oesophagostomum dentatum]|uniref:Uncharacterized protein n=1 Tax=Oesophagostomum dentatum TaxID=61180 RepID=A0A0B1TNN1_OESDE|nr:hypothetical protein OESDEN_02351 [Oesophagostomum dentatum]
MALNLHTPGKGLLETHISWDDIEQRIREERNLEVSFGPKKSVHRIGEDKGFMSRIAVIEPDFEGEVDGLPEKFALKMVCILASVEIAESVKERHGEPMSSEEILEEYDRNTRLLHNREVNVYRVFSRFDNSISKMPLVYFSKGYTDNNDVKGYIGMEFVENAEFRHVYHNIKPEELSSVRIIQCLLLPNSLRICRIFVV